MSTRHPRRIMAAVLPATFAISAQAAEDLKPKIGEPLRDAAVSQAPDGTYYLTGTRTTGQYQGQPDFMSNDGVRLWSSKDLVEWKDEGLAWNLHPKDLKGTTSCCPSR